MGQQHPMGAKGNSPFNLTPDYTHHVDTLQGLSTSQNHHGLAPIATPMTRPKSTGALGLITVDTHSQSVRAVIDSFIEDCLAGSCDEGSSPPQKPPSVCSRGGAVDVIMVPDDEDDDDDDDDCRQRSASRRNDSHGAGSKTPKEISEISAHNTNSTSQNQSTGASTVDRASSSVTFQHNGDLSNSVSEDLRRGNSSNSSCANNGTGTKENEELTIEKVLKNIDSNCDRNVSTYPSSDTFSKEATVPVDGISTEDAKTTHYQSTDKSSASAEVSAMIPSVTSNNVAIQGENASSAVSGSENGRDGSHREIIISDESTCSSQNSTTSGEKTKEFVSSVRLKTIIDHVLDTSLGVSSDLNLVPAQRRILPQIAAEEKAASRNARPSQTDSKEEDINEASSFHSNTTDPLSLCFMEHIEKAIERSFSPITAEEEQKEKEKALVSKAAVNKNFTQEGPGGAVSPMAPATSAAASSAEGSTISVQDIVDRVISQTEMISMLMTTSTGPSSLISSAPSSSFSTPLVSNSGSEKGALVTGSSQVRQKQQQRVHKEFMRDYGRHQSTTGNPSHDLQDGASQGRFRGIGRKELWMAGQGAEGMHQEDVLTSMYATMAKYGQVPSSLAMPAVMSRAAITQGYHPMSVIQNAMVAAAMGLHPAAAPLLPTNPLRGHAPPPPPPPPPPQEDVPASQPPPLLKVKPSEKLELLQLQQLHLKHKKHPHRVSKSCPCASCVTFFGRNHDEKREQLHQMSGAPHLVPRVPVHPNPAYNRTSPPAVPPSSLQLWPGGQSWHVPENLREQVQPKLTFPSPSQIPRPHHPYLGNSPAYCGSPGVPASQYHHINKTGGQPESPEAHYPKEQVRGNMAHFHQQAHPAYENVGEAGRERPNPHTISPPGRSSSYPPPLQVVPQEAHSMNGQAAGVDQTCNPNHQTLGLPAEPDEDTPLDLSAKKRMSPPPAHSYQNMMYRPEGGNYHSGSTAAVDPISHSAGESPHRLNVSLYSSAKAAVNLVRNTCSDRESEIVVSGTQHLHHLENSGENYFHPFQPHQESHGEMPPLVVAANLPPPTVGILSSQHNSSGVSDSEGLHVSSLNTRAGASSQIVHAHTYQNNTRPGFPENVGPQIVAAGIPPQNLNSRFPPQNHSPSIRPHTVRVGTSSPSIASVSHPNISAGIPLQSAAVPQNISGMRLPHTKEAGPPQHDGGHVNAFPHPHHPSLQCYSQQTPPNSKHFPGLHLSGERRQHVLSIPSPDLGTVQEPPAATHSTAGHQRGRIPAAPVAPVASSQSIHSTSPTGSSVNFAIPAPISSHLALETNLERHNDHVISEGIASVSQPNASNAGTEDQQSGTAFKHESIMSIIGDNDPNDILYLICQLCRQTYGNPYGFRKHFRNLHGFDPKVEHTIVQTISATKSARQASEKANSTHDPKTLSAESCHGGKADQPSHSSTLAAESEKSVTDENPQNSSGNSTASPCSGEFSQDVKTSSHKEGDATPGSSDINEKPQMQDTESAQQEEAKCLECPECGQEFQLNDFGAFRKHCRQHAQDKGLLGGGPMGFFCKDCQCSFPDGNLLQEHLAHDESHRLVCAVCHLSFPSPTAFQEHTLVAHGTPSSEHPSSSSPTPLTSSPKPTSLAESQSTISSTCGGASRTTSADFSDTSFNITVNTPSDLKICRLPADPTVTSASPDSSSDKKDEQSKNSPEPKAQDVTSDEKTDEVGSETDQVLNADAAVDSNSVSSSEQNKTELSAMEVSSEDCPKAVPSQDSSKSASPDNSDERKVVPDSKASDDDKKELDVWALNDSNSASSIEESSTITTADENSDEFLYKHKKFSAHRKRSGSGESLDSDSKKPRIEADGSSVEKMEQSGGSSDSDKTVMKTEDVPEKEDKCAEVTNHATSGTEARHQMPFVWDRVTRGQAGKITRKELD